MPYHFYLSNIFEQKQKLPVCRVPLCPRITVLFGFGFSFSFGLQVAKAEQKVAAFLGPVDAAGHPHFTLSLSVNENRLQILIQILTSLKIRLFCR
jgi:hypothetical protein